MGRLSSVEERTRKMVLAWLTPKRWCALSEENKIKIYLKVYDKAVPNEEQKIRLDGDLTLSQVIKLAYTSDTHPGN